MWRDIVSKKIFAEDERKDLSQLREVVWACAEEREGQRLEVDAAL